MAKLMQCARKDVAHGELPKAAASGRLKSQGDRLLLLILLRQDTDGKILGERMGLQWRHSLASLFSCFEISFEIGKNGIQYRRNVFTPCFKISNKECWRADHLSRGKSNEVSPMTRRKLLVRHGSIEGFGHWLFEFSVQPSFNFICFAAGSDARVQMPYVSDRLCGAVFPMRNSGVRNKGPIDCNLAAVI